ncbi:hypothetical protein AGDE_03103 [Angomonas deanei]|nr:hypothetical protein AGDE_03103 [Angomonas deanei]|eukprot:EPY40823.1 hypothetical protein AGDE_03103 [Angomonas deanei]
MASVTSASVKPIELFVHTACLAKNTLSGAEAARLMSSRATKLQISYFSLFFSIQSKISWDRDRSRSSGVQSIKVGIPFATRCLVTSPRPNSLTRQEELRTMRAPVASIIFFRRSMCSLLNRPPIPLLKGDTTPSQSKKIIFIPGMWPCLKKKKGRE